MIIPVGADVSLPRAYSILAHQVSVR
jgi:hypothetical protein